MFFWHSNDNAYDHQNHEVASRELDNISLTNHLRSLGPLGLPDPPWVFLSPPGSPWVLLGPAPGFPGSPWVSPDPSGSLWIPLNLTGSPWVFLGSPSPPWAPWVLLGPSGSLWVPLGPPESPWVPLGSPGFPQVSLGPPGSPGFPLGAPACFWVHRGRWRVCQRSSSGGTIWTKYREVAPTLTTGPEQFLSFLKRALPSWPPLAPLAAASSSWLFLAPPGSSSRHQHTLKGRATGPISKTQLLLIPNEKVGSFVVLDVSNRVRPPHMIRARCHGQEGRATCLKISFNPTLAGDAPGRVKPFQEQKNFGVESVVLQGPQIGSGECGTPGTPNYSILFAKNEATGLPFFARKMVRFQRKKWHLCIVSFHGKPSVVLSGHHFRKENCHFFRRK